MKPRITLSNRYLALKELGQEAHAEFMKYKCYLTPHDWLSAGFGRTMEAAYEDWTKRRGKEWTPSH